MESTGKYYIPVYNVLEGHISNIAVANPKWVRAVKSEKDDDKDAKWIAGLFKFGIVNGSFIPSKDIRILRELSRYKFKLTSVRFSEKNRYQNALTVGNCKLDMVFLDVFGKPHPVSPILFYQMSHTLRKIFFLKFMEDVKQMKRILSTLFPALILLLFRKLVSN
ncbi:hypothetical protein Aargi30884_17330 [Amedibacterium intestinale]|uniref:Transposase IS110-like N-terminal domain-containing protein n=1 Tax=Amedibacterium intestinale TaxID=2583452 RepID=A0A6N4TII7_9FIRM|nr:IS110 family transposase [Amedibacterium intestinale]BBK22830.1 hypothetical protein Aargi30884_17330 [Amedibacterium intestinale]